MGSGMRRADQKNIHTRGFTIVELMVATAVFSVLLIVITVGILQISRVYYKGVTESNTQSTARRVIDIIAQSIQFSGSDIITTDPDAIPGTPYSFCIGNEQFSYALGYQVTENPDPSKYQTHHGLVQHTLAGCNGSSEPQDVSSASVQGRELLAPNMRLSKLNILSVGPNLYRVDVRVVYGDDDLLHSPSDPGSELAPTRPDAACVSATAGTQFCAVAELSTIVRKRVQ
jgi:prepilin-type N-terminal cleavage/methylation domain-containing protein